MDFEQIDKVHGDSLEEGDIVLNDDGDYVRLGEVEDDEDDLLTFPVENLTSTYGEDFFIASPSFTYPIFRSY